ncbi:MAG: prepilin-type N-terminal cleavage/methylation domain-containing protein [Bacillota bacterium]
MIKGMRRDRDGFTLIELVVVITILGVLVAIAIPTVGGYVDDAKKKGARADAKNIQTALIMYKAENGVYPPDTSDYSVFRNAIKKYVSLPEQDDRANFDFVSYDGDAGTHGFYVLVRARDRQNLSISIYEDDIIGP